MKHTRLKFIALLIAFVAASFGSTLQAQFYNGSQQTYGKNRVQYETFFWKYYQMERFNIYFYEKSKSLAGFVAEQSHVELAKLERFFDYKFDKKIHVLLYNKYEHFKQSNIGLNTEDEEDLAGVTNIVGTKLFVYYNGDQADLVNQIKQGLAKIVLSQMMFGENLKEVVKNAALLNLPEWYTSGLVLYSTQAFNGDFENKIVDGVLTGKFNNLTRLRGQDAELAGFAIWHYIAETYGVNVIPNVLYMTRVSRNVESGFLYVLGLTLDALNKDIVNYYSSKVMLLGNKQDLKEQHKLPVKTKASRSYKQLMLSPDGTKLAFTSNEMGQRRIWIYDKATKKLEKIFSEDHKLDRISDDNYPVIAWHPTGEFLGYISEYKGKIMYYVYPVNNPKEKTTSREMFSLERVHSMEYTPKGSSIILSATQNAQSDLFEYFPASNTQTRLTNDPFDDLNPAIINNGTQIAFLSNRSNDSLNPDIIQFDLVKSLYLLDFKAKPMRLLKASNQSFTTAVKQPEAYNNAYTFLSDESGLFNRYVGFVDSAIVAIDTTIHYRYFANSNPVTNYKRGITEQSFAAKTKAYADLIYSNGKYNFYYYEYADDLQPIEIVESVKFTETATESILKPSAQTENKLAQKTLTYKKINVFEEELTPENQGEIDINNYQFGELNTAPDSLSADSTPEEEHPLQPEKNARFVVDESKLTPVKPAFELPKEKDYHLTFVANELTSKIVYDYANQMYQPYNGGNYVNPGSGLLMKIGLQDIFEDYLAEAGLRYSLSGGSQEFFVSLEDRSKQLDKKYVLSRLVLAPGSEFTRTISYQAQAEFKYPFTDVSSVRATVTYRNDNKAYLSLSDQLLQQPNEFANWGAIKLEYVFDNALNRGINIKYGTKAKAFAEYYNSIDGEFNNMLVLGTDIRHYQQIHREFIWAVRIAAGTSALKQRLVYYLGGVDNWVMRADQPRFSDEISVDQTINYAFQTNLTNLRGFEQNIRNGSSFGLINSEFRMPIVRYLSKKPVKSEFANTLQIVAFQDFGTAWTGFLPTSDENAFRSRTITRNPLTIRLQNTISPFVGSVGVGFRAKILGYFVRIDRGWGIEDGLIQTPLTHISLGLDF